MTDTEDAKKSHPEDSDNDARIGDMPKSKPKSPQEEQHERARKCGEEIDRILRKYRCSIHAFLTTPEPVGQMGDRMQIGCTWGVNPSE